MIRFGAPIWGFDSPETWIAQLQEKGYTAAYWPLDENADNETEELYRKAAEDHDIIIAEVGAWSNPLSPNQEVAAKAMKHIKNRLATADRVGAKCCVNIAGAISDRWDGPSPDNFTENTFARIVDTVREIIDSVKPSRTYYTLELMPWIYPYSAETYLDLIKAIDRECFAVHLDPVNIITNPKDYYCNRDFLNDLFDKLGPWIKSCHAKDILLTPDFVSHISETAPGKGNLDYATYLTRLSKLSWSPPLMLEHLNTQEEYGAAAAYIKQIGKGIGVF